MKKLLFLIVFIFIQVYASGQGSKIGVRSGAGFYSFLGEKENVGTEEFKIISGFHFGINYSYYFNDYFGIRAEILYNQKGVKQRYNGPGYSFIQEIGLTDRTIEKGTSEWALNVSNAYLAVPISFSFMPTKKWELYAGFDIELLISPVGAGTNRFTSSDNENLVFKRSLRHNYFKDEAQEFVSSLVTTVLLLDLDGDLNTTDDRLTIPKVIGAYYNQTSVEAKRYNRWDLGLHAGFSYFINRSFFIGVRAQYGLFDVTNDKADFSIGELTDTNEFIERKDFDHQVGFQLSFGFRF